MKHAPIVLLAFALASVNAHAATTVDFEGEDPSPMANIGKTRDYVIEPGKGISSSKAVVLDNLAVTCLLGPKSAPLPPGSFAASTKYTVGVFFNLSAFPNAQATKTPGQNSQTLWLGLVDTKGFTGLPFVTVELKDSDGAATLRIKAQGPQSEVFKLRLNQWYYLEASFTRLPKDANNPSGSGVNYELALQEATPEGLLSEPFASLKATLGNSPGTEKLHTEAKLDGPIFPGFKGHLGFANGARGVMDNFFVDKS